MTATFTRTLFFEGILNARELGGIPLSDGRRVRTGCLLRTGRLSHMTKKDCLTLEQDWQVTDIVDLRNGQEVAEYPDLPVNGAAYHHLSLFPGQEEGISREEYCEDKITWAMQTAEKFRGGGARRLLQNMYPDMVSNDFCIERLRDFFQLLLSHEQGALICHCTSGKDRTGLCCALLLWVLGAAWDTILEDYLLTNRQLRDYREKLCSGMRGRGADPELIEQICILESVDAGYLESCLSYINARYESLDSFLENRLEITAPVRRQLKEKYTCSASGPAPL